MYTPTQYCLYCSRYDSSNDCAELSNKDPYQINSNSTNPGLVENWIKCTINDTLVIVYGV